MLLGTIGPALDEQETNEKETDVPIGASTSIPKTSTISLVTTKGRQEITLLLSSHGEVFKDEMGMRLFHFIYQHAEQLFGNSIQNDWRNQAKEKKAELFKDVIMEFGDPGFDEAFSMSIAQKYTHSKRDNLRTKLKNDRNYPRPAWISDPKIWDELIKDGKFKRKVDKDPNYRASGVGGSNGRLQDTTKATQARVSSIGSHKLGSGGYSSICGGLAHQFQKEAVQEDLNYALLHGSQSLRKHLLDRGEILASGHENEGTQQLNSSSSENGAELGESDELFVAHNNSNIILEPQQETILESEHAGNKNNKEGSISDEQTTPTIRMVPHKKRTQRKKI